MGKKNKKNKRQRTDDNGYSDHVANAAGPDGIIPNGFTIDFDDFQDHVRPKNRYNKKQAANGNGEDVDDDEDSTQQAPRGGHGSQVLPFAMQLPEDHSGEPVDGHEYLYFVRREAASHPSVKTAEAFIRRVDEEITMEITEVSTSAGPSHRPSNEWRSSFLSRFSNMRQVMASSSTQPSLSDVPSHYLPIPSAQDESSWRTYIKGRKGKGRSPKEAESTTDQASQSILVTIPPIEESLDASNGDSTDINLEMPPAISATAESSNSTEAKALKIVWTDPRPPIPTLMRSLDHYTLISLLEHFQIWLSDRLEEISNANTPSTLFLPPSMTRRKKKPATASIAITTASNAVTSVSSIHAVPIAPREPILPTTPLILTPLDSQWIFSLLTVLDPLLSSGEISILRGLARTCQEIAQFTWTEHQKWLGKGSREHDLNKYTESVAGCWMIIAIIWEIWGQRDLWEA